MRETSRGGFRLTGLQPDDPAVFIPKQFELTVRPTEKAVFEGCRPQRDRRERHDRRLTGQAPKKNQQKLCSAD